MGFMNNSHDFWSSPELSEEEIIIHHEKSKFYILTLIA